MAGMKEWGGNFKGSGLESVRRRPRARSVMRWKKREEDFLRPFCPCEEGLEFADGSQYGSEEANKGEEEERKEDGSKGSEVEGGSMYEDGRECENGEEGGVADMGEEGRENELLLLLSSLSLALLSCLRLRFLNRTK